MCAASTRWVEYSVSSTGSTSVTNNDAGGENGEGTRAYTRADGASSTDSFSIGAGNNRLHTSITLSTGGTDNSYVTLTSGTNLDPRFVARDITEKLHNLGIGDVAIDNAQCVWENGKLMLYSGNLGGSASVSVVSGTNTAHIDLGWGTATEVGGTNNAGDGAVNQYNGAVTVSGTYNGFFDEVYTVVISKDWTIATPVKGGSNSYTGTITTGGIFNHSDDITYTLNIDTTNGTTMGGGTGNVPQLSWTSTDDVDNSTAAVELLYPDYFYKIGTHGLMVKFTDAVFSHCPAGTPAWTIACTYPQYTDGSNTQNTAGNAQYVWGSSRGDDSGANPITTSDSAYTRLGSRGLYITFGGTNMFSAGDTFTIICTPPQPQSYDITNLNYGNVTVSTEAAVKCVIFEIMSGAIEMSTVKFGLQNHGTFSHHNENNSDTYFRFGTVGPGQPAGSNPQDGLEWRESVTSADIDNDTPPSYLYATEDNLSVVSDADYSEAVGSSGFMGMTSDPIFLNIKLGASEVGANSTINYRIFFDYS